MSMSDQKRKAEAFIALHVPGTPLVLFNIWDAGSAKAVPAARHYLIAMKALAFVNGRNTVAAVRA
jgi:2-methylisocitrate lyase-like PEP mutase family enzyme